MCPTVDVESASLSCMQLRDTDSLTIPCILTRNLLRMLANRLGGSIYTVCIIKSITGREQLFSLVCYPLDRFQVFLIDWLD